VLNAGLFACIDGVFALFDFCRVREGCFEAGYEEDSVGVADGVVDGGDVVYVGLWEPCMLINLPLIRRM
jgi:hypothetical protein